MDQDNVNQGSGLLMESIQRFEEKGTSFTWPSRHWRSMHRLCDRTRWGLPAHHAAKCPWLVFCLLLDHYSVLRSPGKVYNPYLRGLEQSFCLQMNVYSLGTLNTNHPDNELRGEKFSLGFKVSTICTTTRIFRLAELILKYLGENICKGLLVGAIRQTR